MIQTICRFVTRRNRRFATLINSPSPVEPTLDDLNEYTTGQPPTDAGKITVTVIQLLNDQIESLEGRLLDLSFDGAKLLLSSKIEIGEAVGLRIRFDENEIDLSTAATVCWAGFRGPQSWIVGVSLAELLPQHVFETISNSGYLERRTETRNRIEVSAQVTRGEKSQSPIDIRLDDWSTGGFCMLSPESFEYGEQILLNIKSHDDALVDIPAEVRWKKDFKLGFSIGCKFMSPGGSEVFASALSLG